MRCDVAAHPSNRPITQENIASTEFWQLLDGETQEALEIVAPVLPFRTNSYVLSRLIDWDSAPDDPIYRLTFPHRDMLEPSEYERLRDVRRRGSPAEFALAVTEARAHLNPNSQGQSTLNVPLLDGRRMAGVQHKYHETALLFPAAGQTCFTNCTYCFRWAQFVGDPDLLFAAPDTSELVEYLRRTPEVTDVLVTGGDPMTMSARRLQDYIEPLLAPDLEHVQNIRIGTKAPASYPLRFFAEEDSDDLLRLLERVAKVRSLALMVHISHPVELSTLEAEEAIERLRNTGAVIRTQAPVLRHINDDPAVWAELWSSAVRLGITPYYMFVGRDTGAKAYFELPLVKVHEIYQEAYSKVTGLARSVRGPVMSATPGKVRVLGVQEVDGERVFVLDYLQARDPSLVRRPFFARYDPEATWFDQLRPLEGDEFRLL